MGTRASTGWLAACLASFCESHTHPGGHFSIRVWLHSSEAGATTKCTLLLQTPHTALRFSGCLCLLQYLRRLQNLPQGQASRGWDMSIQETGPIPHPSSWVAHQTPSPGTAP